MRVLAFVVGLVGVVGGASAGDLNSPFYDSDAAASRLMFEARFGGEHGAVTQRSFQLQFGSERQLNAGIVPFRTEYRQDTGSVLVNGVDLRPMLFSRAAEGEGWVGSMGGWIPLAIVLTAVSFVVIDGRDNGITNFTGSGSGI